MTPTQQLGYQDQKAGKLDPDLSRADNAKGREYRDGMRARRRDETDGPIDSERAPSETKPVPSESNAPFSGSNPPEAGTPAPEPFIVPPVHEKKKTRKAKPADEGQTNLFE